jgi:hypothetical protein
MLRAPGALERRGKVLGRGHVELSREDDDDRVFAFSNLKLETIRRHA